MESILVKQRKVKNLEMEKKVSWEKMKELPVLQQVRKVGRVSQIKQ